MSEHIDTREGWREWNFDTDRGSALPRERVQWTDASGFDHYFVRVDPVPPLPTEPYTVIRTGPMRWMKCGLYVHPDGGKGNPDAWVLLPFESQTERRAILAANLAVTCVYDAKHVREQAAEFGWEPLAVPAGRLEVDDLRERHQELLEVRRETAQAVIERAEVDWTDPPYWARMRELFEVAPPVKPLPNDTGLSHEAFAESYPNEVQFHYDGGFRDGVKAALERVQAAWIGGPDAHFHAIAAIKKDLIGDADE